MNKLAQTKNSVKKFVAAHKVDIAFIAGVTVTAVLTDKLYRVGLKQHDDFLKAHGLYDAFYTPEDEN